jgi:hypothetical protein
MPYTITCFRNWATDHASWESLSQWLQSEQGGKLRIVDPRNAGYAIVRYVKGQSDFEKEHVPWCRSVVINKTTRLPVSIAPPKGKPVTNSSPNTAQSITAEEFMDGTMVNIFQDGDGETVQMATRSRVGGGGAFYQTGRTFEEMCKDALQVNHGLKFDDLVQNKAVEQSASFTSIVLQHPSNRIVKQIHSPTFAIVHQGLVEADGTITIEEDPAKFQTKGESKGETIQTYAVASIRAAKSVVSWVAQQAQERGFGWQGVVIKDGNGNRWRIRSQVYETVRRIRGNESTHEERYARLRKARMVDQYLAFYPEDREQLYEIEGRFRKHTKQLAHLYGEVFRAKKIAYNDLPWPYKHHVSVLHNLYKDTLRKEGKKITLEEVIVYVNGLSLEDTHNMMKEHTLHKKPTATEDAVTA